ncbi:hypothetical protein B2J93_6743 [Marssonina coronariae]|uniref:N-acetyltransferase domain-containing protein n=1 Tax=Diplocarpon coronariae TaxID=2795749 RepID=A0A218ZHX5_9HELO|nr:hypothetical protein B2J93_6743 [Marssonina coronariae]
MASKCPDTSLGISIRLDVPGGDYYLTPFREDDIQANYELMSQDAILDELIGVPKPYTLAHAESWVMTQLSNSAALLPIPTVSERNGAFFSPSPLACAQIPLQVIRHGSTMIGSCGLSLASCSPQRVEVGYWLSPAYHGQRIMYAACRALLRYAANEWGVRCVEGRADGGNERSARIIARLAWEARGAAEGEVQCVMGVEKWPENKKGGGERVVRRWDWTVEPEEGWECEIPTRAQANELCKRMWPDAASRDRLPLYLPVPRSNSTPSHSNDLEMQLQSAHTAARTALDPHFHRTPYRSDLSRRWPCVAYSSASAVGDIEETPRGGLRPTSST